MSCVAHGCHICGLTHSFVYLVCFVPHLCVDPFGLGREPSTASRLGFFQGWTWGWGGMDAANCWCYFPLLRTYSPYFPFLQTFPAQALPGTWSRCRRWDPGWGTRMAKNFFYWFPALDIYLAFFSIRIRGFVFLLIPVWKHFTPSCIEWLNWGMGKGSSEELNQATDKMKGVLTL